MGATETAMIAATDIVEPQTIEEAFASDYAEQWLEAMKEEIASLDENNTWTLEKLPHDKEDLELQQLDIKIDLSHYIHMGKTGNIYLLVYVDDILITTKDEGEPLDTERYPYSSLIGALLYLSVCTRPDIAYAVGALSRYMAKPTAVHWKEAIGVVRYLAGTPSKGILYDKHMDSLTGYCDADNTTDIDTHRSTTEQVADALTKALSEAKHIKCLKGMGMA